MKNRVLFVGPMLGRHPGLIPNPAEEIAHRLIKRGFDCGLTSLVRNRYVRFFDILLTIILQRKRVHTIFLMVYTGLSIVVEDAVSALAKLYGINLIMVLHGGAMLEFANAHPRWFRRVLSRANQLFTPSHFLAKAIGNLGFNLTVIPNGINLGNYPFRTRNFPQPYLVWLRGFHKIYDPATAVRALSLLVGEFPDLELMMAGPDYQDGTREEIIRLADRLGISPKVKLLGTVPKLQVPDYLDHGAIFINTTLYESFGISVVEAAAMGLCIITTNVGELPNIWVDGLDSFLVPPSRPEIIAERIRALLLNPELMQVFSRNARKKAEAYDWEHVLPQWESVLRMNGIETCEL